MNMTSSLTPPSPTGRLTTSNPDLQYFPGTPQALAQSRRLKAALAQGNFPLIDFSSIEDRIGAAELQNYFPIQP
jgi:DNA polymerase I-like protein with 3'-5' exonuclease and polymerase domains